MQSRLTLPLMPFVLLIGVLPVCAQAPATMPPAASTTPPAASTTAAPAPKPAGGTDKPIPSQSSVAAKIAFGTVPASDKSVATALDAKDLAAGAKLAGKPGSIQGTVTQVYSPSSHSFVALDFAPNYRDALTANVAPADYAKFPDLTQLAGKHILVSGKFVTRNEATQLAVTSPDQIKIVP